MSTVKRHLLVQIILVFVGAFVCVSLANANDRKMDSELYAKKCASLNEGKPKQDIFVIWDSQLDDMQVCFPPEPSEETKEDRKIREKREKLSKELEKLNVKQKEDLLSFRFDDRFKDHNTPIFASLVKVKKGQNLPRLSSKAYSSPENASDIIGSNIDPIMGKVTSKGYVFITRPNGQVQRKCDLLLFPDGFKNDRLDKTDIKKSCILMSRPIHFKFVPVEEILYPQFSIKDAEAREGKVLEFEINKTKQSFNIEAALSYKIVSGSASQNDYTPVSDKREIVFSPNDLKKTILVESRDDKIYEGDEKIQIEIFNPTNGAEIERAVAEGVIKDLRAIVSVFDAQANEGDDLRFKIERKAGISNEPISINYSFDPGTASGEDFDKTPGILNFSADELEKFVTVETVSDKLREGSEKFKITIDAVGEIQIANPQATGTIYNVIICSDGREVKSLDDCQDVIVSIDCWDGSTVVPPDTCPPPPLPSSGPFSVAGGKVKGGEPLKFVITRSAPFDRPVMIRYETQDETAKSGVDYEPKDGVLEFTKDGRQETLEIITKAITSSIDKTLLLRIYSENDIQFTTSSAVGVIERSCGTNVVGVQISTETTSPTVEYIRKVEGYQRIFETKGVIQPCSFAYVSVNGTYLKDIQTGNPVSTRADVNGNYKLTFAAASIEGTQERAKAIEEAELWQAQNNETILQIGDHYDIESERIPENLAVYTSEIIPSAVSSKDLNSPIGGYVFAMIPSQDGCFFEYRYNPTRSGTEYYEYSLKGIRKNGLCHIQAVGRSTFPNQEHVLFANKGSNSQNALFTPGGDGKFDVSVPFPDVPNFYRAAIYLSGNDYSGLTVSSEGNYTPVNSLQQPLTYGQEADGKEETALDQEDEVRKFFNGLLVKMAERYNNCPEERVLAEIDENNACDFQMNRNDGKLQTGAVVKLQGIQAAMSENENARKLLLDNIDDWGFALILESGFWKQNLNLGNDYSSLHDQTDELVTQGEFIVPESDFNERLNFNTKINISRGKFANPKSDIQPVSFKFKGPGIDLEKVVDWIIRIGTIAGMLYAFYRWFTELRFMNLNGLLSKNRRKTFFAVTHAYRSTSALIADAVNAWGYSRDEIDYNDVWSVKEQAGKILDYVYSRDLEEDFIRKLKRSKPTDRKVEKLFLEVGDAS